MINISSKFVRNTLIALLFLGIAGYAYYQTKEIVSGPIIELTYPADGITLKKSGINIKGKVKNSSFMTLNDRQIFANEEGFFEERVLLSLGYNILEIEVKDKFDRARKKELEIIYNPEL